VPIQGVSMAYSFREAAAPTRRQAQVYELLGDRAIWHQGWKAVAKHVKGVEFDQDRWELYHLDRDFSECHDLAAQHPEKLREMIERWWVDAAANNVLPLDDREFERAAANVAARARRTYTYFPRMARIDRLNAPDITDRSYRITAEVEIPASGAEGVLLTAGSRFAGYVLYLKDGWLVYEYAYSETLRHTIRSAVQVPEGRRALGFTFVKTGPRQGRGTLLIDDQPVGSIVLPRTWPVIATTGGVHCGRDGGLPVTDAYTPPFPFTGALHRVRVELSEDGRSDPAVEAKGTLAEE